MGVGRVCQKAKLKTIVSLLVNEVHARELKEIGLDGDVYNQLVESSGSSIYIKSQ